MKKTPRTQLRAAFVLVALCALFVSAPAPLAAQGHLAVELGHPVYSVIETAELRGVVTRLSSVKPYTSQQVSELLATMLGHMDAFSPAEQTMIRLYAQEFTAGKGVETSLWKDPKGTAEVGIRVEATTKLDAGGIYDLIEGSGSKSLKDMWNLTSLWVPHLQGEPLPWLSFRAELGYTLDKIEKSLYLPYEFTKQWDACHIPGYSDGTLDYPTASYDIAQDIAAETDNGALMVRFSRFRRDWGIGSGSFSLSGTARPFVGIETAFRPSRLLGISGLVGSLTNWEQGNNEKSTDPNALSFQKMFGIQRLEIFPTDWLSMAGTSTIIGAKRFELGYMAPLIYSTMYQNQLADIDNLGVQVDGQLFVPRFGKVYGSFYADEMEINDLFTQLFTKARNMFAIQGGLKISLPKLTFATLTAQYTKIEPFVYSHYATWYPDYRLRVDTSYTQDGENLGYYLPPNSDEFLVRLDMTPAPGWRLGLKYSFVRHGDNPQADWVAGLPEIFGNVNDYMDYGQLYSYNKSFLHDGIYDYNHIGSINIAWRPLNAPKLFGIEIPLELGAGYGLAYTWSIDGTGAGRPALVATGWKNVLSMSLKLFL